MEIFKRYRFFALTLGIILAIMAVNVQIGLKAVNLTLLSFKEMIVVIPPVFVLLGLLDVWVPRETMVKYMGEGSGLVGILLAIILGSAAAGPLYGAFPIATVFMKKGVKLSNIFIFIGAWSTTKIPMFLFELSALGAKFAVTRLAIDIPGIIIISYVLYSLLSHAEREEILAKAESL